MDTRSRNIKYSTGAKVTAVILAWLFFMSAAAGAVFLLYNQETVASRSFFDTNRFKVEFAGLVYDTVELNVKLKSEENIKASGEAADVIANNLNLFGSTREKLSSTNNFIYYIEDTQTGKYFSNMNLNSAAEAAKAAGLIRKQAAFVHINQWTSDYIYPYNGDIKLMLKATPYEVYAAVRKSLEPGDELYNSFMDYARVKAISDYVIPLLIISVILLLAVFIYLLCVTGRREKDGEIVFSPIDSLYTDVHTLLVFLAAVISLYVDINVWSSRVEALILTVIILSIDVFIGLSYILSMARQIKGGRLFKNTLLYAVCKSLHSLLKLCLGGRLFKASILLLLLGYGLANGILFAVGTHINGPIQAFATFVLFVCFNAAALYFAARALLSLTRIMESVREISGGNIEYALDSSEISVTFAGFAENLRNIQRGLKKAVAEAVKGERMKTELITNVSHDLKTPLTSIINYVDLLKKEDLGSSEAEKYVGILEEKSARLKQLIEDLIEASKASSGSLAVNIEKVDLHELVMQACGEYEEKFSKAALDVRIAADEKSTLVSADGKYMWRVVENLLSNAVKYSMSGSRVYVNINRSGSWGCMTVKNISSAPLNIPPEQLTERFVRGDASRTTEGSGLGLSIARSLTELQGGRFSVDIDGDLFKVTVEIPVWEEA